MENRRFRPNAELALGRTWHVARNHAQASDDGPGTAERPFETITRGAGAAGVGDRVVIHEGVYREEVPLPTNGHPYRPATIISFEAAPGDRVWLRGSDPFDAEWTPLEDGIFRAPLPDWLFEEGVFNPCELSAVSGADEPVRPCDGPHLPETLGALWLHGEALGQVTSVEAVRETPESFAVSADGRSLIAHFEGGEPPDDGLEITVRERCLRPLFDGEAFIETAGIQVEHAARPGPFCYGPPLSIRRAPGVTVRREPVLPSTINVCRALGEPAYVSGQSDRIVAAYEDSTGTLRAEEHEVVTVSSENAGLTWQRGDVLGNRSSIGLPDHFLDERHGVLLRWYTRQQFDPDGAHGRRDHEVMVQISRDGARNWSEPEVLDRGRYYFRPIVHSTGTLVWPFTEHTGDSGHYHGQLRLRLGQWDGERYRWSEGGVAETPRDVSSGGLSEPAAVELPDGRIFILLRAGDVTPLQDRPGVPSVKRWCISEDGGKTLSAPEVLTHEDGSYLYSPRAFPGVWRPSGTDRVFVIVNRNSTSSVNCDPRTSVEIGELDPDTLTVRRDSVVTIEHRHPEHHRMVRFSNWSTLEDRQTGDLLLFMQLHMSEYCPVRRGYDFRVFRYRITLED